MTSNLEKIEQNTLRYLAQVSNPLVRIEVLHAHLTQDDHREPIPLPVLKEFLEAHEHIRVIEPLQQETGPDTAELLYTADSASGVYSVLNSRIPSERQITDMMLDQLGRMQEALAIARTEAENQADITRIKKVSTALNQIDLIKVRLSALYTSKGPSG